MCMRIYLPAEPKTRKPLLQTFMQSIRKTENSCVWRIGQTCICNTIFEMSRIFGAKTIEVSFLACHDTFCQLLKVKEIESPPASDCKTESATAARKASQRAFLVCLILLFAIRKQTGGFKAFLCPQITGVGKTFLLIRIHSVSPL